jgi:dynein heavy chain
VFRDRLINAEDRAWFETLVRGKVCDGYGLPWEQVVPREPLLFGDHLDLGADTRRYVEMADFSKVKAAMDEALDDYNATTTAPMKLVLFQDAVEHAVRLGRILRQPLGNALCLGVGGSGRQSMTRLAAAMAEYECFQIELAKNYGVAEWREDIKKLLKRAGLEDKPVVFLFSDTQIKSESFLEDLNNILNSGDVPGIYESSEEDEIFVALKPIVQAQGINPTKSNLFNAYCQRVRANVHSVICMAPIGEVFRARLRQFPALVNCCTIDWYFFFAHF